MAEKETEPHRPAHRVNASDMPDHDARLEAELEAEAQAREKRGRRAVTRQAEQPKGPRRNGALHTLRMTGSFVEGTVGGMLNGFASGARMGLWGGLAAGILGVVAVGFAGTFMGISGLGMIALGMAGFAIGGALVGAAVGLVTGGAAGMRRETKRVDEEEAAQGVKPQPKPQLNLFEFRESERTRGQLNFDRHQQQLREDQRDATHWQDRVSAEQGGWGMGRG